VLRPAGAAGRPGGGRRGQEMRSTVFWRGSHRVGDPLYRGDGEGFLVHVEKNEGIGNLLEILSPV
jgi:hypothetical protein